MYGMRKCKRPIDLSLDFSIAVKTAFRNRALVTGIFTS